MGPGATASPDSSPGPVPFAEQPAPRTVDPDPALVASMGCEPVEDGLLSGGDRGPHFSGVLRAVQVEGGEGNEPGSRWRVVVLEQPGNQADPRARRCAMLTNAPGLEAPVERRLEQYGGEAVFIDLPEGDRWRNVDWDDDGLVRAASALECATGCLGEGGDWIWGDAC